MSQTLALSSTPTKDNSPVSEVAYSVESGGDGVYSVSMLARYSAEGEPLNTTQKELISQLLPAIESKSVFISERGLTSSQWTEYSEHTKRVQYSTVPTSSITAGTVTEDGSVLSQKDTAGVVTTFTRSYTVNDSVIDFQPEYDADGNQTRVKTSTGIWAITYDTKNRSTDFTSIEADSTITTVHCEYDSMGRRAIKRVMVNGNVTLHQRYIYRGYLQIACIDLTRSHHPALWYITWDPTQNIATRLLALQKDGSWYTYGWDLTKNICEGYSSSGYIRSSYTYTPYGLPSQSTNGAGGSVEQPLQWSSEFNDAELGLIYYNYRHYNPMDGRWLSRDIKEWSKGNHVYAYVSDSPVLYGDQLGQDRYYYAHSGDCLYHGVLIVDNWEKVGCKYKKRKPVEYGLAPKKVKYFGNFLDVVWEYLRPLAAMRCEYCHPFHIPRAVYITAKINRRIYRQAIPKLAEIIKSTPEEDIKAHNILVDKMKNEYPYNVIHFNCHHWASENKYIGMKGGN